MHGLEQARHVAARAEIGARGHAHAALQGGAEVGQDVAEEVGGDDDVEAVGPQHHARREGVHEHPLVADVGVALGHGRGDLVPEHVAVARGVRLGRARDEAAPLAGEREGVLDDPLDAGAREDGGLDADLAWMTLMRAAPDARVLALGVLAHEQHVDIAGRAAGQGARHACQQPHGPHVGPQVEALADRQQQPPERHVIGNVRPADRAEQHRVERAQLLDRVRRHHHAVLQPVIRAPAELAPLHGDPQRIDAAAGLGDDLGTHAVAWQERNPRGHRRDPSERGQDPRTRHASMPPTARGLPNASLAMPGQGAG